MLIRKEKSQGSLCPHFAETTMAIRLRFEGFFNIHLGIVSIQNHLFLQIKSKCLQLTHWRFVSAFRYNVLQFIPFTNWNGWQPYIFLIFLNSFSSSEMSVLFLRDTVQRFIFCWDYEFSVWLNKFLFRYQIWLPRASSGSKSEKHAGKFLREL